MTPYEVRLPVPDWGRPGETWRVEAEPGGWEVVSDGVCGAKGCYRVARVYRSRDGFTLCGFHIDAGRMWIENGQLVSWALRP